jgi:hypothetical protein
MLEMRAQKRVECPVLLPDFNQNWNMFTTLL